MEGEDAAERKRGGELAMGVDERSVPMDCQARLLQRRSYKGVRTALRRLGAFELPTAPLFQSPSPGPPDQMHCMFPSRSPAGVPVLRTLCFTWKLAGGLLPGIATAGTSHGGWLPLFRKYLVMASIYVGLRDLSQLGLDMCQFF
jgi:hypothetical protein